MEKKKNRLSFSRKKPAALIVPVLLLLLWEILGRAGYINPTILPTPGKIFEACIKLINKGRLQADILISLRRVMEGYLIGAFLGIVVGVGMGMFPTLENLMSLITGLLRPIPIVAWVPVLILWMGIGEASKVTVIAIGSFWPVLLNVTDGIRNVDVKYKEVAQVFVKPKRIELFRVILPAALPMIFTGLRISVGTAWVSVIGAELIASSSGLGYLIQYSRELSQPANMLVGVFAIGVIGLLINKLIVVIEKYALHWNRNIKTK